MKTSELGHTGIPNRTQVSLMKTSDTLVSHTELGHTAIPNRTQVSLMKTSDLAIQEYLIVPRSL